MRKLTWFSLGFGAAMILGAYSLLPEWFLVPGILLPALTAALLAVFSKGRRLPVRLALIVSGCCLALVWWSGYQRLVIAPAAELDGRTEAASIRVTDYPQDTRYGQSVDGALLIGERSYRVRVYLDSGISLSPGDRLEGRFRFRQTSPGGREEATYHRGRGIFLLAYQTDEVSVSQGGQSWRDFPARLRLRLKTILSEAFPEDAVPFAKALLLGDTRDLGYEVDTSFKVSGIRHVVAVSGLHVSILFGLVSLITFRKRVLTGLVGFSTLLLFAALAGFTPTITRSCLMFSLVLLAMLLDRDYDGPTALAFSVLVMLMLNPSTASDTGFQLSVASVAGIFLFCGPINRWLLRRFSVSKDRKIRFRLLRWVSGSAAVTLSATVMTAPLCAVYFGTVSLVGVLTNLLALWVIAFIFYGILLVCLLGSFWPAGAAIAAWVVAWPIRYVLWVAGKLAAIPFAAVYTRSPYIVCWLTFGYLLLALFYFGRRNAKALICCGLLGLCAAMLASWAEPRLDGTRMTVLDVGQGQCILLQSEGRSFLVDCGGDSDEDAADLAAETLLSQGIARLDGLILTHPDRDHAGAVPNLLTRVDTDLLILPPWPSDLPGCTSRTVVYGGDDLEYSSGGVKITVYSSHYRGDSNENSLCVLFESENCVILITGDRSALGEKSLLRSAQIPRVDILVAGHHGSKNATSQDLLSAVRPEIVCISAGRDNPYGHPAPETLDRLQACGCTVFRTDLQGDILIRR